MNPFDAAESAAMTLDTPAPTVDLRTAAELDQAAHAAAERSAQQGSACSLGLRAESLAVADDIGARRSQSLGRPRVIDRQATCRTTPGPHRLRGGR
ncbi:MAG TPA: hypothetical protein VIH08_08830 [Blastococcus sp.]